LTPEDGGVGFCDVISKDIIVKDKDLHKKNAMGHTSMLIPIFNKRFVYTEELKKDDEIISDIVKKISSSENIGGVRECYGRKTITIQPFCKFSICTNHIFSFDITDIAITDRLIIHPHNSRYLTEEGLIEEKSNGNYKPDLYDYRTADKLFVNSFFTPGHNLDVLFSWLVIGTVKYYDLGSNNVVLPPCVKKYISSVVKTVGK
jgi:hypothetical protein